MVRLNSAAGRVTPGEIVRRTRSTYPGALILAEDLMTFVVDDGIAVIPLFADE